MIFKRNKIDAPRDDDGDYDIPRIEVGQIIFGQEIIYIPIHDKDPSDPKIIFITNDFQLSNINFENTKVDVSQHESIINQCEEKINLLQGRKRKIKLLVELASYKQSLFLVSDDEGLQKVKNILNIFLVKVINEEKIQYQYFNVLTTTFLALIIIFVLYTIILNNMITSISMLLLKGLICGLIGMICSTIYSRIGKFKKNKNEYSYNIFYALIDSVLKIILTFTVVFIFYIGYQSKLFLNIATQENEYLFLFFTIISGFSEHFVPDLIITYSKKEIDKINT